MPVGHCWGCYPGTLSFQSSRWRHNERDGVSNYQPHDCLLNRLLRCKSKKTSKLRVIGLCAGNSPVTGEFPAQMASNAENVSIWWRHHGGGDIKCRCVDKDGHFTPVYSERSASLKVLISNRAHWLDPIEGRVSVRLSHSQFKFDGKYSHLVAIILLQILHMPRQHSMCKIL